MIYGDAVFRSCRQLFDSLPPPTWSGREGLHLPGRKARSLIRFRIILYGGTWLNPRALHPSQKRNKVQSAMMCLMKDPGPGTEPVYGPPEARYRPFFHGWHMPLYVRTSARPRSPPTDTSKSWFFIVILLIGQVNGLRRFYYRVWTGEFLCETRCN